MINIQNTDDKCFLWTAIAGVYGDLVSHDHQRVSHYKHRENDFNMKGISTPVALKDIPKFERQNDVSEVRTHSKKGSKMKTEKKKKKDLFTRLKLHVK